MRILFISLFCLALLACNKQAAEESKQTQKTSQYNNNDIYSGEIIVQTKSTNKPIVDKHTQVETIDAKMGVYLLKSKSLKGSEKQRIQALKASGDFKIVEPNYVISLKALKKPRDPKWLELWGLKNYGQDSPSGVEGKKDADISAQKAWEIHKGSKDVIVAVIDTGIDYTHPDLQANIWVNQAEKNGTVGVDDDGNGYVDDMYGWDFVSAVRDRLDGGQLGDSDPMDDHGHGTHCAGTIGAVGNNKLGVVGVNWNVQLMALKFLDSAGSGSSADAYRAIRYATENNVDVINASYGGGGASKLIRMAIEEAGKAGVLFVAAAGNSASDNDKIPHYPSNYDLDSVLSVAASDNRDQLAGFSCYGATTVDIAAPGVSITSTFPVGLTEKEPYATWSGTSMATPHVAGAAALVLAANPSLKKNPVALKKQIMKAADWLPHLSAKMVSGGRLNLYKAVKGIQGNSPVFQSEWQEEEFHLSTPKYPTKKLDHVWKIQKKGAKAIQVHVRKAIIDTQYDIAAYYDSRYRKIMELPELIQDTWLPITMGDTAYLKFSNALVAIQEYLGSKTVTDTSNLGGAMSVCFQEIGASEYECHFWDEIGESFANFNSEGIVIDKIRYIPGDQAAQQLGAE